MALHNTVCFQLPQSCSWKLSNSLSKTALNKFNDEMKARGFEFVKVQLDKEKLTWEADFKFDGKSEDMSVEKQLLISSLIIDGMRTQGYKVLSSSHSYSEGSGKSKKLEILMWFELDKDIKPDE